MTLELLDAIQFALVIPLGLLWREKVMLANRVDELIKDTPSKEEMKEYVQMANAPLDQKLDMLLDAVKDIKEEKKRGD